MIVTIPAEQEHDGYKLITLEISDYCPICGGKRGTVFGTISFDGSRKLNCDAWRNPCGHVDTYADIRAEGKVASYKHPAPDIWQVLISQ